MPAGLGTSVPSEEVTASAGCWGNATSRGRPNEAISISGKRPHAIVVDDDWRRSAPSTGTMRFCSTLWRRLPLRSGTGGTLGVCATNVLPVTNAPAVGDVTVVASFGDEFRIGKLESEDDREDSAEVDDSDELLGVFGERSSRWSTNWIFTASSTGSAPAR